MDTVTNFQRHDKIARPHPSTANAGANAIAMRGEGRHDSAKTTPGRADRHPVRWRGGRTQSLSVQRPKSMAVIRKTAAPVVVLTDEMLKTSTDRQIARKRSIDRVPCAQMSVWRKGVTDVRCRSAALEGENLGRSRIPHSIDDHPICPVVRGRVP
jgi:hypothetical protein